MEEVNTSSSNKRKRYQCINCFIQNVWRSFLIILLIYIIASFQFYLKLVPRITTPFNHDRDSSTIARQGSFLKKQPTSSSVDNNRMHNNITSHKKEENAPFRILHIVTALDQYNTGRKSTIKYKDRLTEILIPSLKGAIKSMLQQPNWHVDAYLILGFNLSKTPLRKQLIIDALVPYGSVSLEIWDDATPYGYDAGGRGRNKDMVQPITRALARQHRYVIKDKLDQYDFFTAFEDDMRITSHHILAFRKLSQQLELMKHSSMKENVNDVAAGDGSISGPLSVTQLERVIPGFFRVEVLVGESMPQSLLDPIPVDLVFNGENKTVNPDYCCAVPVSEQLEDNIVLPVHPKPEQLMTWETAIKGFSVRKFPDPIGWVALLPGRKNLESDEIINSYWSGENGKLGLKAGAGDGKLFGQQGGFMATQQQIKEFQRLCPSNGFLPPYNLPLKEEGLYLMNVEFWSGGYQLLSGGIGGCNMQRIIPISDPDDFSKFLLYHTTNNKQVQRERERRVLVRDLLGQLNSVRKIAEGEL